MGLVFMVKGTTEWRLLRGELNELSDAQLHEVAQQRSRRRRERSRWRLTTMAAR
jgi:hypothetical protein